MAAVRTLIFRAPGANCDGEAQFAFELAGAAVDRLHVNRLREQPALLHDYQILCIPGGFAYGDDVAAGKILANQLRSFLSDALRQFHEEGKLILGICNGFQVLLKAGLLLPATSNGVSATLAHNANGKFEDRWITMRAMPNYCPFLEGYDLLEAPIAHGEGNFTCRDAATLHRLEHAGQVVLRYVDATGQSGPFPINPNGSQNDIAGICDTTGRVLGLMPHPERNALPTQHPRWTRDGLAAEGPGLRLFRNAVRFMRQA